MGNLCERVAPARPGDKVQSNKARSQDHGNLKTGSHQKDTLHRAPKMAQRRSRSSRKVDPKPVFGYSSKVT